MYDCQIVFLLLYILIYFIRLVNKFTSEQYFLIIDANSFQNVINRFIIIFRCRDLGIHFIDALLTIDITTALLVIL